MMHIGIVLFILKWNHFESRLEGCHRCTLLVQLLIDEILDSIKHGYKLLATFGSLCECKSGDHEASILIQDCLLEINLIVMPVSINLYLNFVPCISKGFFECWQSSCFGEIAQNFYSGRKWIFLTCAAKLYWRSWHRLKLFDLFINNFDLAFVQIVFLMMRFIQLSWL